MIRIAQIFVLTLFTVACAAVPSLPIPRDVKKTDYPEVGKVVTAEVGDTLVMQGNVVTRPGIRWVQLYEHKYNAGMQFLPHRAMKIEPGDEFIMTRHVRDADGRNAYGYCGEAIDLKIGNTRRHVCLYAGYDGTIGQTQFTGDNPYIAKITPSYYEPVQIHTTGKEVFERRLIYTGKSKNQLHILYREFINDMARPAFSQNLTFDLEEGKVVGFQGARFEIIKATNTQIIYKMMANFRDRRKPN